jgi:hypothetical protein
MKKEVPLEYFCGCEGVHAKNMLRVESRIVFYSSPESSSGK